MVLLAWVITLLRLAICLVQALQPETLACPTVRAVQLEAVV
jgi:hypothetical protein